MSQSVKVSSGTALLRLDGQWSNLVKPSKIPQIGYIPPIATNSNHCDSETAPSGLCCACLHIDHLQLIFTVVATAHVALALAAFGVF
jgi:hypothetical protein